ncbi:MAG: putative tRNA-dihydrouridine synthase, partial [Pseudomonadota bacterium]
QIIDINMGCPAKKVCNVYAGSALMADEALAIRIIDAVANAVPVPVTVKMRTGPAPGQRNAVRLARLAESAGAAMITVHGRTRACAYRGQAEYDTIAEVKANLRVPVVANGDINSPERARDVLARTGADAVMIGRAAQGRPWIFREIVHFLATGETLPPPGPDEFFSLLRAHLLDHYAFYGEFTGVRTARKHVGWYMADQSGWSEARDAFNALDCPQAQLAALERFAEICREALARDNAANDRRFSRRRVA